MTKKKRNRKSQNWRIECDYKKKLTPEEKAWLDKFQDEYQRNTFTDNPLHNEQQRKELYQSYNTAWADIVTQTNDEVRSRFKKSLTNFKQLSQRVYTPDDYVQRDASSLEDALIDAIDAQNGGRDE